MDGSWFDTLTASLAHSRRTLLGTTLATAGAASGVVGAAGKKKKKKKCKAPATKCGKSACCQPGQSCVSGQCRTSTTTTPAPFSPVSCPGPNDITVTSVTRFAQIFTANGTGLIRTASFEAQSLPADIVFGVEIRTTQNGAPTTTVLGTAIVFGLPTTASPLTVTATFAPQVAVQQGVTYALVITNVTRTGYSVSTRNAGACPEVFWVDSVGSNTFSATDRSLVFSVSS